jgi:hypothetical protein
MKSGACVRILLPALALLACLAAGARAQQSQRFGPYELHYSAVNTTLLSPQVAAAYGITRGRDRAILNIAIRDHRHGGSVPQAAELAGQVRDLLQKSEPLAFREIREGPAIYYIAQFRFINEEWRTFEVQFRPEGTERTYTFEWRHQLYFD